MNRSTFHHFPLLIFLLFVANRFLPDLYQSAISLCHFLVPAEDRTGWFASFVVAFISRRICTPSFAYRFVRASARSKEMPACWASRENVVFRDRRRRTV